MKVEIEHDESQGRWYVVGNTFDYKDDIKALGGRWDGERKAWYLGSPSDAEAVREHLEALPEPEKKKGRSYSDRSGYSGGGGGGNPSRMDGEALALLRRIAAAVEKTAGIEPFTGEDLGDVPF